MTAKIIDGFQELRPKEEGAPAHHGGRFSDQSQNGPQTAYFDTRSPHGHTTGYFYTTYALDIECEDDRAAEIYLNGCISMTLLKLQAAAPECRIVWRMRPQIKPDSENSNIYGARMRLAMVPIGECVVEEEKT